MRHAAGAICRPNCMQFAYTLSLPYKKCDYIFSSRLVSHCSLWGYSPINEMCNGKCASFICSSSSSSSSCSFASSDIFFISENKQQNLYVYSVFGSHTLPISFSLDPHSGCGDRQRKFFSISLSLASPRLFLSSSLQVFPSDLCIFLFLFGLFMMPRAGTRLRRYLFHNC